MGVVAESQLWRRASESDRRGWSSAVAEDGREGSKRGDEATWIGYEEHAALPKVVVRRKNRMK